MESVPCSFCDEPGSKDPVSLSLSLLLLALNVTDSVFTLSILENQGHEMNPLWDFVIHNFGSMTFFVSKLLLILLLVGMILTTKRSWSRGALLFLCGYYVNLFVIQLTWIWHFNVIR